MSAMTNTEPAASAPGEFNMKIDDAVAYAMQRHQAGDLGQAEQIYEAVLEHDPERIDVLNLLGILKYQRGEHEAAIALMRRVVDADPNADGAWNNLGNALLGRNQIDEAAMAYKRSLELVPTAEAWANPVAHLPPPRRPGGERAGLPAGAGAGTRPPGGHAQPGAGLPGPAQDRRGRGTRTARDAVAQAARAAPPGLRAVPAGGRGARPRGAHPRGLAGAGARQTPTCCTTWPRARAARCRGAPATPMWRTSSTASPPPSTARWSASSTARRGSWPTPSRARCRRRRASSTSSTSAAAPACAARCCSPGRACWRAAISPPPC